MMELEQKRFVLGIGAQKSGTSWVRNYLCNRADIYISPAEMHFFDSRFGPLAARRAKRLSTKRSTDQGSASELLKLKLNYLEDENGVAAYKEFFRTRVPGNVEVFGEITPSYALVGEAGYRAAREIFPNARIFFIMRDPAERFYSQVGMNRNRREKRTATAGERKFLVRAKNDDRSLYEPTIRSLERVFPQEQILYLFYEELFRPDAIRRLCRFLGVPYLPADLNQIVNAGGPKLAVSEDLDKRVRACFETTYAFCQEKFGDRVPKAWRRP